MPSAPPCSRPCAPDAPRPRPSGCIAGLIASAHNPHPSGRGGCLAYGRTPAVTDRLIPVDATRAATRAGIRTAAQTLASAIPAGGVVLALTGDWWTAALLGSGSAVVSSMLAGAAAYLSILSKGIPEDYAPVVDGGAPRRAVIG